MYRAPLALAVIAAAATAAFARPPAHAARSAYTLSRVPLPGPGRGDYLTADEAGNQLYVSHGSVVHILDLATLAPVGEVSGLAKVHGVAIAGKRGFASDGGAGRIVVFDPATGAVEKTIPGGRNPDCIVFDPASGMVFAFNGGSKDVSVIDPAQAAIVATIPIGDKPEFARADGRGMLYVNLEGTHAIAVIDTRARSVARRIVLPDCEGPAALGLDSQRGRLFSSCGNGRMKVVDAASGRIVGNLPVGEDPDGIVYDPLRRRIIVAARDGGWTIVRQLGADRYQVAGIQRVDRYAKTLAFDSRSGRLFSSTADLVWPAGDRGHAGLPDARPGSFRLVVATPR